LSVDLMGKLHIQEGGNGAVLAWVDLQTLHSLATSDNMEHVSSHLVVGDKFCIVSYFWGEYFLLPIQDEHVLCRNRNVSMYQYKVCMLPERVPREQ
jgi:hypothetical protein